MSDFHHRYQHLSHAELYDQLKAGRPDEIDGLVTDWVSMEGVLNDLARSLETDLEQLSNGWDSASGDEFRRRVRLIMTYARDLSTEFRALHEGLSMMSGPLRQAQAKAEHPDETDDHDKTVQSALIGGVAGGVPGMIVGGIFGHQKDEEEQEKAHQRMIQLVADLAADYDLSQRVRWEGEGTPVPVDLPGNSAGGGSAPIVGPRPDSATTAPTAGAGGGHGSQTVAAPGNVSGGPTTGGAPDQGMGSAGAGTERGTSLAGAGGGGGALLGAAWAAGAAGVVGIAGSNARGGGISAQTTGPIGGLLGTGAGGGSTAGARGGLDAGRAAMGPGRGGPAANRAPDLGLRSGGADTGRSAAGTGRSQASGEDEDEQLTWLTEDEMVWQGKETVSPPVLGIPDGPDRLR